MIRLYSLILTGLIIRLTLIPLPGFKIDVDTWAAWASRVYELGFSNFYSDKIWTNYTPGYLYILWFLAFIKNIFHIDNSFFYLVLKLPSIISEIILGMVIYQLLVKKSVVWARLAAITVLFNPAFIFNGAVWGQIDGLLSLLMMLSIYYLNQKKLIFSSIYFGLSFLIKPQAVALLPVFGLFLIKNLSTRNLVQLSLPSLMIIFLFSSPFFINQPILGLPQLFAKMVSDYSYTSLFAYNLWGIIGFWISDSQLWNGLSYQTWGYILFLSYWIIIGYFYFRKKLSVYGLATLATLGFFFLPTRVHERYLYLALLFLILTAAILKSRMLLILTAILSLIHFLNLYYVYVYYNEFYLKMPKILYNPTVYNLLDAYGKSLSLLSTAIFILVSIMIIKSNHEHKKT